MLPRAHFNTYWVVAKYLALGAMSRLTCTHTEYVIDLSFGCSVLSCSAPDFISVGIQFE